MDTIAIKDLPNLSNGIHGLAAALIAGESMEAEATEHVAEAVNKSSIAIKKGAKKIGRSIDNLSNTFDENLTRMSSEQGTRDLVDRFRTVTQDVLALKKDYPTLSFSLDIPLLKMGYEYLLSYSYIFSDPRNDGLFELFKSECRAGMNPEGFLIRYLCHAETFHTHAEVDKWHNYFEFDGVWMKYNDVIMHLDHTYLPFLINTGYPAGIRVKENYFGIAEDHLHKRAVPMLDEQQIHLASYIKQQEGDSGFIDGKEKILSFFIMENMRRMTTAFEQLYAERVLQVASMDMSSRSDPKKAE